MADSNFIYGQQGAESVVTANNKIAQSQERLKGTSTKAGMAILEASRGLEDFAMAGMRGVMNNIPGLLMNLGIGMGLTGVLSVLLVTVYSAVDAVDAYLTKLEELKQASLSGAGSTLDIDKALKDRAAEIKSATEEAQKILEQIKGRAEFIGMKAGAKENIQAMIREVELLKELYALSLAGASEAEKRNAENKKAADDAIASYEKERQAMERRRLAIVKMQDEINKEQSKANQDPFAAAADYNREKARIEAAKLNELKAMQETVTVGGYGGAQSQQVTTRKYTDMEAQALAIKFAEQEIERIKAGEKARIEQMAVEKEQAKLKIAAIEAEIAKQEELLKQDKLRVDEAKSLANLQIRLLEEKEKMAKLDDASRNKSKKPDWLQKQLEGNLMPTDISSMVSEQGRRGMAANESQMALNSISFQKSALISLKNIDNNTRKLSKGGVYP
jgi:hypothetical protein